MGSQWSIACGVRIFPVWASYTSLIVPEMYMRPIISVNLLRPSDAYMRQ